MSSTYLVVEGHKHEGDIEEYSYRRRFVDDLAQAEDYKSELERAGYSASYRYIDAEVA